MTDIRRPQQYEQMFTDMCTSKTGKQVFLSYKDMLVFATCLGYSQGRTKEFNLSSEPVGMHIFKGEFDEAVFNCIGLAETGDPAIMGETEEKKRVEIFEKYACGGLDIIKHKIYDYENPSNWENALIILIIEQYTSKKSILDDITNLGS